MTMIRVDGLGAERWLFFFPLLWHVSVKQLALQLKAIDHFPTYPYH